MIRETKALMNREARFEKAQKVLKVLNEEAVYIFLYNEVLNYGVSRRVKGFDPRPDDKMHLFQVSLMP